MDTLFTFSAVIGGALLVGQFLLTLLGMDGDHDIHADMPSAHGDGHATGHGIAGLLTLRGLSAAATFFGLVGLAVGSGGWNPAAAFVTATLAGFGGLLLVGVIMGALHRMHASGNLRIETALGARGTVYLTIPAGKAGAGKVHLVLQNRTAEFEAVTDGPQLPSGCEIVVSGIVGPDAVEVRPAPKS